MLSNLLLDIYNLFINLILSVYSSVSVMTKTGGATTISAILLYKQIKCISCSDMKVIAKEATTAVKLGKVKTTYIC